METIAIEFPARRYHATPWDAHVNEGRVDWPPSPWRLLRALLAVGYNKLGWSDRPDEVSQAMLEKLAAVAPHYSLPAATDAHTRHYLPTREKTAKVFDAFLRFAEPDARLLVHYDVTLTADERAALERLVAGLSYLGRAESWAEARLLPPAVQHDALRSAATCRPFDTITSEREQAAEVSGQRIRLLAALPPDRFDPWRSEQLEATEDAMEAEERAKQAAKGKSLSAAAAKRVRAKAAARFPTDPIAALQTDTATWQSNRWPQPPGSQWLDYHLPATAIERQPLTPLPQSSPAARVPAVLLAIDGDGKRGTVRPLMKRALPLMELLHAESVRKSVADLGLGNLPELTGKADDGTILRGHHHAHWLPLSLFGQERIDHVLVHCRDGFSSPALAALAAIRWAYAKGIDRLSINLAGMGDVANIAQQLSRIPACRAAGSMPLQSARRWRSVTPLVFRKFLHQRGKKSPERQVREELAQRGFDAPVSVRFWSADKMVANGLKGFVLTRKPNKPQPPMTRSFAVTLEFERPQNGPIQLGYASHFGLGLFGGCDQADE